MGVTVTSRSGAAMLTFQRKVSPDVCTVTCRERGEATSVGTIQVRDVGAISMVVGANDSGRFSIWAKDVYACVGVRSALRMLNPRRGSQALYQSKGIVLKSR